MACTSRLAYLACVHVLNGGRVDHYQKPTGDDSPDGLILCSECGALADSIGMVDVKPWASRLAAICESCGESIVRRQAA